MILYLNFNGAGFDILRRSSRDLQRYV